MKIIRKTVVKQVLTKDSKNKIEETFKSRYTLLEKECHQLQFEKRKLQTKKSLSPSEVNKRFQLEIEKRQSKMQWIEYQLEQLDILPLGSEIAEDEVEEVIDIQVGDDWSHVMGESRAIIIKDGIVTRIG